MTLLARSSASTEARVPSERAMASQHESRSPARPPAHRASRHRSSRATRRAAAVIGSAVRGTSNVARTRREAADRPRRTARSVGCDGEVVADHDGHAVARAVARTALSSSTAGRNGPAAKQHALRPGALDPVRERGERFALSGSNVAEPAMRTPTPARRLAERVDEHRLPVAGCRRRSRRRARGRAAWRAPRRPRP